VRAAVIIALGLLVVLLAGCTTTHTRSASVADGLESTADAFAARACYDTNPVCSAAFGLTDQARKFRETLDIAGDEEVVFEFKRLWRSYQTLRGAVYLSHDRQLRADLKPTTQAFSDVQRIVKNRYAYADRSLYANGAYTFSPYYY
jgi:hypothetical protein